MGYLVFKKLQRVSPRNTTLLGNSWCPCAGMGSDTRAAQSQAHSVNSGPLTSIISGRASPNDTSNNTSEERKCIFNVL